MRPTQAFSSCSATTCSTGSSSLSCSVELAEFKTSREKVLKTISDCFRRVSELSRNPNVADPLELRLIAENIAKARANFLQQESLLRERLELVARSVRNISNFLLTTNRIRAPPLLSLSVCEYLLYRNRNRQKTQKLIEFIIPDQEDRMMALDLFRYEPLSRQFSKNSKTISQIYKFLCQNKQLFKSFPSEVPFEVCVETFKVKKKLSILQNFTSSFDFLEHQEEIVQLVIKSLTLGSVFKRISRENLRKLRKKILLLIAASQRGPLETFFEMMQKIGILSLKTDTCTKSFQLNCPTCTPRYQKVPSKDLKAP